MAELWERLKNSDRPVGRPRRFDSPLQLLNECFDYFEWNKENPLYEEKVFHSQGEITRAKVAKMRAMTLGALFTYLQIDRQTWENYSSNERYTEFFAVTREVEEIIRAQKFEGAACDLLNANIIARDLGLADKQDVTVRPTVKVNDLSGKKHG